MRETLFCFVAVEVKNRLVEVAPNWKLSDRFLDLLKFGSDFSQTIVEKGVVIERIGEKEHVVNFQSSHIVSIGQQRAEVKVSKFIVDREGLPAKLFSFGVQFSLV